MRAPSGRSPCPLLACKPLHWGSVTDAVSPVQMSSTLRQLNAGFLDDELFQATCARRLSSPFFLDSIRALIDAVPVVGRALAYAPDPLVKGWRPGKLGHTAVNTQAREKIEALTLTLLQRGRRVVRLATAMSTHKYTAAGAQLLTQDLRSMHHTLDALAEASALAKAAARSAL